MQSKAPNALLCVIFLLKYRFSNSKKHLHIEKKQIKQPTTTLDIQLIIINQQKLENYVGDKEPKSNCLPSSVLMNLHLGERELSFPLSIFILLDYNEIYNSYEIWSCS